jgi:hypothetical protein
MFALFLYRRRKCRRNMLHGVQPIIQEWEKFDASYYAQFNELRVDANKFLNYIRMSVSFFDGLHRRLKESLQRRNSKMRTAFNLQKCWLLQSGK